ncbi:hypothetical protein JANAI62_01830 [Jannaschia pagri]|uniref:Uncharacterized protein n=1 Tax=Jannaschia pagri TaxID=2829797 RepID=A0ABQ4NGM0_9RHOB|nr:MULTISPECIES: hypothetical protein [unclassified Jannaschia]GIT90334.1 hypothetical protein JANAI61_07920 [Jannaschia sp. AI_61]GIT93560.1 hypothetical protein JANAI62_01830 [Jannaschia sp. AI_62]
MAAKGPQALRPIVMALHWATLPVIVAWLVGSLPSWALAGHAAGWIAITVIWGLRGGASPALTGWLRRVPQASHVALLILYGAGAVLALLDIPAARSLLIGTLGFGALHGVFNLWRSSVLGDGCIRRMTPKVLH